MKEEKKSKNFCNLMGAPCGYKERCSKLGYCIVKKKGRWAYLNQPGRPKGKEFQ